MKHGYDIGGAEYPIDPMMYTVLDNAVPENADVEYIATDLNYPEWSNHLNPRPLIYLGKVLRYVNEERLVSLGRELDLIWTIGGTITFFDHLARVETVVGYLTDGGAVVCKMDMVNPPDSYTGEPAEWLIILAKV